jgi:hypothetical protein
MPAPEYNGDTRADIARSDKDFFTDGAPGETKGQRLDRFLEFLSKRRPEGIVEAVTANGSMVSQKTWHPFLKERGFKKVTEGRNSNSNNICTVWHLVMTKGWKSPVTPTHEPYLKEQEKK